MSLMAVNGSGMYSISTGDYMDGNKRVVPLSDACIYPVDDVIDTKMALDDFIARHGFLLDQDGSYLHYDRDGSDLTLTVVIVEKRSKTAASVIIEFAIALAAIYAVYWVLFNFYYILI
jgi:hypothetical protein